MLKTSKFLSLRLCFFASWIWLSGTPTLNAATYTTDFSHAENPISEGGKWINGGTVGLDWHDVRTASGMVYGTQPGNEPCPKCYGDSTAIVTGTWGPNQAAQATVKVVTTPSRGNTEVELRLRTSISAHRITGYEIEFNVNSEQSYMDIVRWNGSLADFTYVYHADTGRVVNGDVVKAVISGNTITAYVNGKQVAQASDSTFSSGSPGVGFYVEKITGVDANFGFSDFLATDELTGNDQAHNGVVPLGENPRPTSNHLIIAGIKGLRSMEELAGLFSQLTLAI